jgi:hypothetical protein
VSLALNLVIGRELPARPLLEPKEIRHRRTQRGQFLNRSVPCLMAFISTGAGYNQWRDAVLSNIRSSLGCTEAGG